MANQSKFIFIVADFPCIYSIILFSSCKVVKAMAKACIVGGTNHTILVRRTHMWLTAMSAFLDSSFDFKHQFTVEFSGELGSDFGGPKREFLR